MNTWFSLRTRLTALYTVMLFGALVIFAVAATRLLHDRLVRQTSVALDHRIQGVERFLQRETTSETAHTIPEEIAEYTFTQPEGHLIDVRDESGAVLLLGETTPPPLATREDVFGIYGTRYHVRASASLASVDAATGELRLLFLGLAPILLVVTMAIGYWVSGRALAPVDAMTRAARAIGVSDLSGRLSVPNKDDELSRLARAWNEMLSRLEQSVTRMQQFTADAAHEPRTPLTAIRASAELAMRRERTAPEYQLSLTQILTASGRMSGLVTRLLVLAHADAPDTANLSAAVDLARLVRSAHDEIGPSFEQKHVSLELDISETQLELVGDAADIRRLIDALLENALHYTPSGGRVTLKATREAETTRVDVTDTGCGIPAYAMPRIFDRFYRVDPSRTREPGGYGLGLSIVQQIALRSGALLEVESVPERGFRFSVRWSRPATV